MCEVCLSQRLFWSKLVFLFSQIGVFNDVDRMTVCKGWQISDAPWLLYIFTPIHNSNCSTGSFAHPDPPPAPVPCPAFRLRFFPPAGCPRHRLTASASWWMWPNGPFSAWWGLRSSRRYGKHACLGRLLMRPSTSPMTMRWDVKGETGLWLCFNHSRQSHCWPFSGDDSKLSGFLWEVWGVHS